VERAQLGARAVAAAAELSWTATAASTLQAYRDAGVAV